MACIVMVSEVTAYTGMAYIVMADILYRYGIYSYGLCGKALYMDGLYSVDDWLDRAVIRDSKFNSKFEPYKYRFYGHISYGRLAMAY